MAQQSSRNEPPTRNEPGGVEDQLWPIVCATAVLMGVLTIVITVYSDFDDDRLLFNGYTQLAAVALLGAAIIFLGSLVKGRARRTAELAILFSLALHAAAGLGAGYIFDIPIPVSGGHSPMSDALAQIDDDPPPRPDFHWGQNDADSAPEQAFEKPVATPIRDQMPPSAQVRPRNLERPVPVADVPRASKDDVTPLGVGMSARPSKPLEVRRPDAAKLEDVSPAQALAMARQHAEDVPIPDVPPEQAVADAPRGSGPSIEARSVQAEKSKTYYWATPAKKLADLNHVPVPAPQGTPRLGEPGGEPLPSPEIVAQLPSQSPPAASAADAGPEAAAKISEAGGSLARADRGAPMPSTMAPDAGPPQLPAAMGGSPGSRIDAVSNVPVEASDNSRAPLGPNIASAGVQDFARGSSLLPTRRGAMAGHGRAQPSVEGEAAEDLNEIRAGSPGSDLNYGMAQPAAAARRAAASQTEDGGAGLSAGQPARLPRTAAATGVPMPAATHIADESGVAGGGGVSNRPGGITSVLSPGQSISVRRVAGNGSPRGTSHTGSLSGSGAGDAPLTGHYGLGGAGAAAIDPAGPRRIPQGISDGDVNGADVRPRAPAAGFDPHATIEAIGPVSVAAVSGSGSVIRGPNQGAGPQGYSGANVGPELSAGGAGRLEGPGQRIGKHHASSNDSIELASSLGVAAPQDSRLAGGRRQGDGQLDQILSGEGAGISRAQGRVDVAGLIHEPLDAFRHGPVHGGPALGDSADGQLTEPAIENGLAYFARTQFPDGHWSLHEAPPGVKLDTASLGDLHADTAATGLALLSYMAAGYTHQDEKYRQTVNRGLKWLVQHQAADGNLSYRGSDPTHFYSQGIAAMALCEAYGMTQDRDLRGPAQKAIDFIVRSQDPTRGGWRYRPRDGADTSVTGWQLMALRSAQMAGLDAPEETLRKIGHWLDLAQVPSRGTYVYNPWNLDTGDDAAGRAPNPTMTAQAMVMRMYLGQDHDPRVLRQGADYLKEHLPAVGAMPDCYYWYYATQAMYHMQGDYWKLWDARVTPMVRAGQIEKGALKGSWNGSDPEPDRWSQKAGRHYVTAMHVLTLEFRYWHLPLFRELRRDQTVGGVRWRFDRKELALFGKESWNGLARANHR